MAVALAGLAGAQVEPGGAAGVAGVTVLEGTQWQWGGTWLSIPTVMVSGPEGLTWHEAPRYPGGQAQSSTSNAGGWPVACGTATSRLTSASLWGQRGSQHYPATLLCPLPIPQGTHLLSSGCSE